MKYPLIWLLCLAFLLPVGLSGQNPYRFNDRIDGPIVGGGVLTFGTSLLIDRKVEPLTPEEIAALNTSRIMKIDLFSTRHYSQKSRKLSDNLLKTSGIIPFTLLIDRHSGDDFGTIGLLTLESFLLNMGLTNLTKVTAKRPRPYMCNPDVPMEIKIKKDSRYSFFSGHTSTTACMYFLTAQLFSDFYPDSDLKPLVWTVAGIIPAITAYTRMKAGKHFFTDVLLGYIVGAAVGIVLPVLHRK